MMPNRTIYVKDADLPLFEQAQSQLGESISSMFADFLRERVSNLTPEEGRIRQMLGQIARKREEIKGEPELPAFLDSVYAEATAYAEKSLESLRRGDVRNAKILYWASNAFYDRAERDTKETKEITEKVASLLSLP